MIDYKRENISQLEGLDQVNALVVLLGGILSHDEVEVSEGVGLEPDYVLLALAQELVVLAQLAELLLFDIPQQEAERGLVAL